LKAVNATDPAEVEPILAELRSVIHEHIQRLRRQTGPLFSKREQWKVLCEQVTTAHDPQKLDELIRELTLDLEAKEKRLRVNEPAASSAAAD
jgi:hypothetical protein